MKKYFVILLLSLTIIPNTYAYQSDRDRPQRLSPAEFRAKQKDFITRDAGLTDDEAAKFFPVYYELEDKKRAMNDKSWQLIRQGDDENLSESQYKNILETIYNNRIAVDRLEKEYFYRFRRIISYKKILRVHRSEMRFSRELIRDMRNHKSN
jgi:hypothetical protein